MLTNVTQGMGLERMSNTRFVLCGMMLYFGPVFAVPAQTPEEIKATEKWVRQLKDDTPGEIEEAREKLCRLGPKAKSAIRGGRCLASII